MFKINYTIAYHGISVKQNNIIVIHFKKDLHEINTGDVKICKNQQTFDNHKIFICVVEELPTYYQTI